MHAQNPSDKEDLNIYSPLITPFFEQNLEPPLTHLQKSNIFRRIS